jgi:predicted nucleotidyltransferase
LSGQSPDADEISSKGAKDMGPAPAQVDESLTREIVRRVLTAARPDKIILFGSAASGAMTRDSDVDLLVVEREPSDQRRESVRIEAALSGLGVPFDVIVISTDWFEASKNVIGGIAYPANKYGKVIYEAA